MKRYLNPDRERLIDERVHSEIGRIALKKKFVDDKPLLRISQEVDMVYSTFTDNYYNKWLPELFYDFDLSDEGKDIFKDFMDRGRKKGFIKKLLNDQKDPDE